MTFFLLALYTIFGTRLSVQRCQLSSSELSKDETRCEPYEIVQTKNERWLSYLQATYCLVLLSRQTLPRNEMPRTVLFQHQAQT